MRRGLRHAFMLPLVVTACLPGRDEAAKDATADISADVRHAAPAASLPDVTLRFQIIEADGFTGSDASIAAVESALRDLFRFRGYRLATETLIRSRAPGAIQQQMVAENGSKYVIEGQVRGVVLDEDGKRPGADLDLRLWVDGDQALSTSVNIPSGQTVVVGTSRTSADRPALILVVRPEIGS